MVCSQIFSLDVATRLGRLTAIAFASSLALTACVSDDTDDTVAEACSFADPVRLPFWTSPVGSARTLRWDAIEDTGCREAHVDGTKVMVTMQEDLLEIRTSLAPSDDPEQDPLGTIYTYSASIEAGQTITVKFVTDNFVQQSPNPTTLDGLRAILVGDSRAIGETEAIDSKDAADLQNPVKDMIGHITADSAAKAPLFLHLGDMQYNFYYDSWRAFFGNFGPLMRQSILLPVVGNHEFEFEGDYKQYYRRYFEGDPSIEGSWPDYYRVTIAEIEWIVLDSERGRDDTPFAGDVADNQVTDGSKQIQWLDQVLANPDPAAKARFVALHRPIWTLSKHSPTNRDVLHQRMVDAGIDAVFTGHNHVYERFVADGLPYVVSGGGGAPLYPANEGDNEHPEDLPYQQASESVYHYVELVGQADKIVFTAKRADDNSVIDTFEVALD